MYNSAVANPRVTLNIVTRDQRLGLEDQRILVVGQKLAGTGAAGLNVDIPETAAEIDAMFGARSHVSMMLRRVRKINPYTNVDVIALADAGGATKATGVVAFAGTATEAKTIYITPVSGVDHRYEIDVETGDTATAVGAKLLAAIAADPRAPFTAANVTGTVTLTAENGGKVANNWPLVAEGGPVAGLTITLTAWAGGATDPTLTTIFDAVENIRYQTVIWPDAYATAVLKTFLELRKNVDNDVRDGRAFIYSNAAFATVKSDALTLNSSEIVILTNEANASATHKGPHVFEAPDLLSAYFGAARALRFEDGISISHIVATNEPNDQFGGFDKCALPYFNTPFLWVRQPAKGSGYTQAEQRELEDSGVSIIGQNPGLTGVVAGVVVTTWQKDVAGNDDDTWKYLEWRDTHGAIREYFVRNLRKEFSQHRLTAGQAVAGYAIADEAAIRAYCLELYDDLAALAITVKGFNARKYFEDNLRVTLKPALRRVELAMDVPMVSQLGEIIGSVKFNFLTQ